MLRPSERCFHVKDEQIDVFRLSEKKSQVEIRAKMAAVKFHRGKLTITRN